MSLSSIKILIPILLLTSVSARADLTFGSFDLIAGAGVRTGQSEKINEFAHAFAGLRFSHTELHFSSQNKLSLFLPGVSFQTDGVFSFSVSPIAIIIPNKVAFGIDAFVPSQNSSGGYLGFFIGFPLSGIGPSSNNSNSNYR